MSSKLKTMIRGVLGIIENLEKPKSPSIKSEALTKSVGELDISIYKLGNGKNKIMFLGCVHGNEIGTSKLVHKLMGYLDHNQEYLKNVTAYFIPVLNVYGHSLAIKTPDYLNGGLIGRTNSRNVDLNRNFGTEDWVSEGIWEFSNKKMAVSGGKEPFSEPETKALVDFVQKTDIKVVFDFHSRAGTILGTKDDLGRKIVETYSINSGYKDISKNTYQNTGWIKNYLEGKGVTYIEIETTKRWGSDWGKNKEALLKAIVIVK